MQGKLFEMSATEGFSSESFIKTFMLSNSAADLDKVFNHMQWAGQGYIIDRLKEQNADTLETNGDLYDNMLPLPKSIGDKIDKALEQ